MSATVAITIARKAVERVLGRLAVARGVTTGITVDVALRTAAERTATIAAEAATGAIEKLIDLKSKQAMSRALSNRKTLIEKIVKEARLTAKKNAATPTEIDQAAEIAEKAASAALEEAQGFVTHSSFGNHAALPLLEKHKEAIVQIATEKVAETTLTASDMAVGVITFMPIPGYQEVEKNVINPALDFMIDKVVISGARAVMPGAELVDRTFVELGQVQQAQVALKVFREENEKIDNAKIDQDLANRNMSRVWKAAEEPAPSVTRPTPTL